MTHLPSNLGFGVEAWCSPICMFVTQRVRLTDRMSENTVNFALKRMGHGGRLTGHGLRATMSTALNEIGYPRVWVDAQLSHADPNRISAIYNHAQYVEQRRVMMQDWANRLPGLTSRSTHLSRIFCGIHYIRAHYRRLSCTKFSFIQTPYPGASFPRRVNGCPSISVGRASWKTCSHLPEKEFVSLKIA